MFARDADGDDCYNDAGTGFRDWRKDSKASSSGTLRKADAGLGQCFQCSSWLWYRWHRDDRTVNRPVKHPCHLSP